MIRRLLRDRITQTEARLCRLEGGLTGLVELADHSGERRRQQRERHLEAIASVRSGVDSGIPESGNKLFC